VLYSLVESKLVRRPVNTAVVQGSAVTFECVSHVNTSNSGIHWFNRLCVKNSFAECKPTDYIYNSFIGVHGKYRSSQRFSVTEVNNATHVTRNVNINSTQLTDAGVYLCVEFVGAEIGQTSSAQLIVLGRQTLSSQSNHDSVLLSRLIGCFHLKLQVTTRSVEIEINSIMFFTVELLYVRIMWICETYKISQYQRHQPVSVVSRC